MIRFIICLFFHTKHHRRFFEPEWGYQVTYCAKCDRER